MNVKYILAAFAFLILAAGAVYTKARYDASVAHELQSHRADKKNEELSKKIIGDVKKLNPYDRCRQLGGMHDNCGELLGVDGTPKP